MEHLHAEDILAQLRRVEHERHQRMAEPGLAHRVQELKEYQQQRFARSYADLLATPRYAQATRFFLQELYGPGDFTRRDAQFARVVPALVRLFPAEVVATVQQLAQLHAISEQLDSRMARLLGTGNLDARNYARAWQGCGEPAQRQAQIDLTLAVGCSLDRLTRKPLLRQALRMMRGPAAAAGLGELQTFLETGFDTFRAMRGAQEFLDEVRRREETLASALFAAKLDAAAWPQGRPAGCPPGDDPLGQLP